MRVEIACYNKQLFVEMMIIHGLEFMNMIINPWLSEQQQRYPNTYQNCNEYCATFVLVCFNTPLLVLDCYQRLPTATVFPLLIINDCSQLTHEGCFDMLIIIDHFLRMEDISLNRNDKYNKVEHKLEMLAQSKLQNLNSNTLRKIEDRVLALEKGVCEEAASHEKIVREYRLLLRKNQEQWHQLQARTVQATNERTNKIAQLKDLMADYFCREDGQSKEIYKQGPAIFEEKTEKLAKELAGQIIQRREETGELQGRVEDALLVFKENMHAHFEELDEVVGGKIGELRANCEQLRKDIEAKTESKRKAESSIMDNLRETVCEIKQTLNNERVERQRNRDKLLDLVNNAREQIARA